MEFPWLNWLQPSRCVGDRKPRPRRLKVEQLESRDLLGRSSAQIECGKIMAGRSARYGLIGHVASPPRSEQHHASRMIPCCSCEMGGLFGDKDRRNFIVS